VKFTESSFVATVEAGMNHVEKAHPGVSVGPTRAEVQAAVHLGVAALAHDDLDEAVEMLSLATFCAPEEVDGYVALGIAHARRREVGQAIQALEHAVSLDPHNFLAHLRLGDLYLRSRRKPRSRAHLIEALKSARTREERAIVSRMLAD
jgi:Flp pilus assembly protein TadD